MKTTTKHLCISAVFAALTFVVTFFLQIPIPLGYFNVGNTVILLGCLMVPMPYGLFFGSIGAALADLISGYAHYTVPTLVIKALMALIFYLFTRKNKSFVRIILATAVSTLIPLLGYTFVGGLFYGGVMAGLAQFPGLAIEYAANLALIIGLSTPIKKLAGKLATV